MELGWEVGTNANDWCCKVIRWRPQREMKSIGRHSMLNITILKKQQAQVGTRQQKLRCLQKNERGLYCRGWKMAKGKQVKNIIIQTRRSLALYIQIIINVIYPAVRQSNKVSFILRSTRCSYALCVTNSIVHIYDQTNDSHLLSVPALNGDSLHVITSITAYGIVKSLQLII